MQTSVVHLDDLVSTIAGWYYAQTEQHYTQSVAQEVQDLVRKVESQGVSPEVVEHVVAEYDHNRVIGVAREYMMMLGSVKLFDEINVPDSMAESYRRTRNFLDSFERADPSYEEIEGKIREYFATPDAFFEYLRKAVIVSAIALEEKEERPLEERKTTTRQKDFAYVLKASQGALKLVAQRILGPLYNRDN